MKSGQLFVYCFKNFTNTIDIFLDLAYNKINQKGNKAVTKKKYSVKANHLKRWDAKPGSKVRDRKPILTMIAGCRIYDVYGYIVNNYIV